MKYLTFCCLFLCSFWQLAANDNNIQFDKTDQVFLCQSKDSLNVNNLYKSYFNEKTFVDHHFDYDRKNEIKKLQKRSREMMTLSVVSMLGISISAALLTVEYDWSLWVSVPCAALLGTAAMGGLMYYSQQLRKKADILASETVYVLHLDNNIEIGVNKCYSYRDLSFGTVGLGVKYSF